MHLLFLLPAATALVHCGGVSSEGHGAPMSDTATHLMSGANVSCMKLPDSDDPLAYISHRISVFGDVERPLELTVEDLRGFPVHEGGQFKVVCASGADMKALASFKGALLRDVLDSARLVQEDHKDRNFFIVAHATDGYMATFSWAELYNHAAGDSIFILYEENGAPIGAQGEFVLVSTTDKKTGPRHVYWLNGVEVRKVRSTPAGA